MDVIKVGLLGFGTIGAGVAKILLEKADLIERTNGKRIELVKICDKDLTSDRGVTVPPGVLTDNISEIMDNPEISIVVELFGGVEPARTFVLRALESGKNVVTANKALIANCGPELFAKARELGRTIGFEASVCGGIPVLQSIQTSLQANRIESIQAIVNGTCNFILSEMESKGTAYVDAVKEAQRLGFAEANPTLDVDGSDSTLAKVTNAINGINIVGDSVGSVFYQGWGAGRYPTASAVCSDVIDCALGRAKITFDALRLWSDEREGAPVMDPKKIKGCAYLRFTVEDRPGVMAALSSALGKRQISIASMLQHEKSDANDPYASVIIMTHAAPAEALDDAIAELNEAPFVRGKAVRLAVRD